MTHTLFQIGAWSGLALIALLALSGSLKRGIWPCPDHWSPESLTFWTLFRVTNVAALGVIVLGCMPGLENSPVRLVAALFGLTCFVLYALACSQLGHTNLYCGSEGLKVRGIYRWSRNPQYATAIPGYIGLAVASHSGEALLLAGLLAIIFVQMALLEERWLLATYGPPFAAYQSRVPRFYNIHRARASVRQWLALVR
jgi:protein-S-isoprenylcysteine O-methyltransferase Ste14